MLAAPAGRTHVYEVVNHLRKESLIVLCPEAPEDFLRRLGPPRPGPIAHWAESEALDVEQIAAAMTSADADEFLALFFENLRGGGWKMLSWRP